MLRTPLAKLVLVSAALVAVPQLALAISTRTQLTDVGTTSGDQLGNSVSGAGDVNGDGYADFVAGAPGANPNGGNSGEAYLYLGGPNLSDTPAATAAGEAASDGLGHAVSGAGDVNGDGYADWIVGAPQNDAFGTNAGRAYVYFGGPVPDATPDWTLTSTVTEERFGFSVSGAGDVNGDGYADVIVGAYWNDFAGGDAGRAYVFYGGPAPDTTPDILLKGESASAWFGHSVSSAGDMNGDGYGDVIVGAPLQFLQTGSAYVYFGGVTADSTADVTMGGELFGDNFGWSVSDAADVNSDGFTDVIVGATNNDTGGTSAGRAYVYLGGTTVDNVADWTLTSGEAGEQFGSSVSGAGDLDGDGFSDIVVGASFFSDAGGNRGRTYAFLGGPAGGPFDTVADLTFTGVDGNDRLGGAVSGAGDVNSDGFADILGGAPTSNEGAVVAGKIYLWDQFRYVLTSPSGADTWPVGSTQRVSWMGPDPADVWLSVDGGLTYDQLESSVGGAAQNTRAVLVPHAPTRFARVKVTPSDTGLNGRDVSDSLFTIESSVALLTFTVAASPGGGAELAWATQPAVGPQGIAGYRLYRRDAGAPNELQIGPSLITSNSFVDVSGSQGAEYRIASVNGLGGEIALGSGVLAPTAPLVAWPLPFRGGVMNVSFASASGLGGGAGQVEVGLFDAAGRRISTLASGTFAPGFHTTTWDGRDRSGQRAPAGMYFLRLTTEGQSRQMKVVVAE